VPVDWAAEAEAELAVVFAALEGAAADAAATVEQTRTDGELRRQAGLEEAQRIVSRARAEIDAIRSEAAANSLGELDTERAALDAATQTEVDRLRAVVEARIPTLVAAVLAQLWGAGGPEPTGNDVAVREQTG